MGKGIHFGNPISVILVFDDDKVPRSLVAGRMGGHAGLQQRTDRLFRERLGQIAANTGSGKHRVHGATSLDGVSPMSQAITAPIPRLRRQSKNPGMVQFARRYGNTEGTPSAAFRWPRNAAEGVPCRISAGGSVTLV